VLKKLMALLIVFGLVVVTTGCPSTDKDKDKKTDKKTDKTTDKTTDKKPDKDKTETDKTADKKAKDKKDDTEKAVKLSVTPPEDTELTEKGTGKVTVTVKADNAKEDDEFTVSLSGMPKSVTVEANPKDGKVKGKEGKVEYTLKAGEGEVKPTKVTITVKGAGKDATADFKVSVKKKGGD
jgi:hypothetical protein